MAFLQHKWPVFVAAFTVAFLNYGMVSSMGALYVGILNTYNAGRAKTALVQSLNIGFSAGFGVVSGFLISKFGVRVIAFCAAITTALGFTLSFFSTTIYELYGYISTLAGIGFSTMYVSAVVCVGRTFTSRQKSMALSSQSVGTALAGFMWPNVLSALLETYSLRGTFLILGAMFLNNVACALIFGNCESESGNEEKNGAKEQVQFCVRTDCSSDTTELENNLDFRNNTSADPLEDKNNTFIEDDANNQAKIKNMNDQTFDSENDQTNVTLNKKRTTNPKHVPKTIKPEGRIITHNEIKDEHKEVINKHNTSGECNIETTHVRSGGTPHVIGRNTFQKYRTARCDEALTKETGQDRSETDRTVELRNSKWCLSSTMTLFSLYSIAGILNMSMLSGFITVYQDVNIFNGLTIAESDTTFMSFALFNVLSRFLPIIPARFKSVNSFTIPIVASLCGAIGQIIYLTSSSLTSSIIAMAFTAVSDGGWMAAMQAITFELLPPEKQAVGFGFILTSIGITSGATGPIFGSLRDDSSSYQTVLMITTIMFLISALLDVVCLVISQNLKKQTRNALTK